MKASKIAAVVHQITTSGLSVDEYYRKYPVPFSRAQYFRYKARLTADGLDGLADQRHQGNHRTLTPEARGFLRELHHANPRWSLRQLGESLARGLGITVDRATVSRALHQQGEATVWPPPAEPQRLPTPVAGFEIVAAVARYLGWGQHTAGVLMVARGQFQQTAAYAQQRVNRDRQGRNAHGQFTGAYNRREEIRTQRFASVTEKRAHKNYSRMALFQASPEVLQRKCLAVLALPLITLNGATRLVSGPLGNALEHFCGCNYRQDTLDKFLRELKYLGVADRLLRDQVAFWRAHWQPHRPERAEQPLLCYYVDGNTKPVWSEKRVKQSKVTMLGRVMGCLEQVFVHDGWGHPVYLETYAGKAPVGEHILELFEKIEDALEGPGPRLAVRRVIVMDAASNGVRTLRAFAAQERYHYITALDDNQWQPQKVRVEGRPQRYHYGQATLRDCELELEDSQEPGYLVVVRAVRIDWDYGHRTVLITSLPAAAVGASLVVKAYFDRWPKEELQFRSMKSFACLNRVAGYGKQQLPDEKVRQTQRDLQARITALRQQLREPLQAIAEQEEQEAHCIEQERRLRARTQIVAGQRLADAPTREKLRSLERERAQCRRAIQAVAAPWAKELQRLRRYEQEWLRLQGKDTVYRIDVELDQILAYFRVALVNISSWFLSECLGSRPMSLAHFFHTILLLPGELELTPEVRRVRLQRNFKDYETMALLEPALQRLNGWEIRDEEGRKTEFTLA